MSTRWYPLYVKGNPQLRIFLPNFWMKLVNLPEWSRPSNEVSFIVSMQMTKIDVKNYLEKIYKVPVIDVRTHVMMGEIKKQKDKGYLVKDEDYKLAYVTLAKDVKFQFPDLFSSKEEKETQDKKDLEAIRGEHERLKYRNKERPDIPNWFGL